MVDKKLISKNFAADLTSKDIEIRMNAIRELENLMGDNHAINLRIQHLENLAESAGMQSRNGISLSDTPFSRDDLINYVKKGFVEALNNDDITIDQIIGISSSIDGLRLFSATLSEVAEECRAVCWKQSPESISQSLSKMLNNWLSAVSPKKTPLMMRTRGANSQQEPITLDSHIEPQLVLHELERLRDRSESIPDSDIRSLWARVPWDNLMKSAKKNPTWFNYLNESGSQFAEKLSETEITKLSDWASEPSGIWDEGGAVQVRKRENDPPGIWDEGNAVHAKNNDQDMEFLMILLKSTDLHKA